MDDLISRKAVLALPRNIVRSLRTHEVIEETINVTDIERLSSTHPEQRWIPCSERLPEDSVYVLLTVRRMDDSYNHVPFISTGYISWNHQCWWCAHDGNCKDANIDVIAWMPLPEPYEEDPCNRCGYLGESCVGEGCGKLTERKDGEADE